MNRRKNKAHYEEDWNCIKEEYDENNYSYECVEYELKLYKYNVKKVLSNYYFFLYNKHR